MKKLLSGCLLLVYAVSLVFADTIYMKDGTIINGKFIEVNNGQMIVETQGVRKKIKTQDIDSMSTKNNLPDKDISEKVVDHYKTKTSAKLAAGILFILVGSGMIIYGADFKRKADEKKKEGDMYMDMSRDWAYYTGVDYERNYTYWFEFDAAISNDYYNAALNSYDNANKNYKNYGYSTSIGVVSCLIGLYDVITYSLKTNSTKSKKITTRLINKQDGFRLELSKAF